LVVIDHELQDRINSGAPTRELRAYAARKGIRTLLHDGIEKVKSGLTTLDEVMRVVPYRQIRAVVSTEKDYQLD
jgi:type II secretory ATPase GspE/PulE/Tfp pilus assembly ATPase PilB-like protein